MLQRQFTKMAESAAKRLKTDGAAAGAVVIGTHNGHFHADEALAVHMLRQHVPAYAGARLVRTRDPGLLATCHTVVDVGGEYDAAARRFDHHQRGFTTTFPGRPTKLSSAGLVYMHFGRGIIARRLGLPSADDELGSQQQQQQQQQDGRVELLYRKLYESFIEAVDANDNGIPAYDAAGVAAAGLSKGFSDGAFTLGAVVGRRNANWNEPAVSDPAEAQRAEDTRFEKASARIGEEFDLDLDYYVGAWLPARAVVEEAFARREADGRILVFRGQSVPWKDHLYSLEDEEAGASSGAATNKVLYVLYPEGPAPDAKWRVQCVPVSKDSFESRKPLPEAWRGVRDAELDTVAGLVPGAVFVHASGFIGGHKTFEGAMQMAQKSLET